MPWQFGPIGVGAVFYVEHTKHLFPKVGEGNSDEANLIRALVPSVYFLVLFSIVVHGLSIPVLDAIYKWYGVPPITDDAVQVLRKSMAVPAPVNARPDSTDNDYFVAYNRFSRPLANSRRTVYLGGKAVGRLPLVREDDMIPNQQRGRPSMDVDPVEEEKYRAQQRADSLQKLG